MDACNNSPEIIKKDIYNHTLKGKDSCRSEYFQSVVFFRLMSKVISVNKEQQKLFAQECRKKLIEKSTDAELTYQKYLKKNSIKFEFQKVIWNKEGSFYIVDFYVPVFNLIVEIDGEYHMTSEQINKDRHRSFLLRDMGYNVIRFTNEEVLKKYN